MEEINDYELLYLVFQGSDCARNYLLNRYELFFRKILKNYYRELLFFLKEEDLVQEAQFVLYLVIERYRQDTLATFKTFVRNCVQKRWYTMAKKATIAKNKFNYYFVSLDQPIKHQPDSEHTINLEDAIADVYYGHQPEKQMMIQERLDQIQYVVKESQIEYAYDITNMKMQGYSEKEIANHLCISNKKVANTIYRIRKKFDLDKH